MKASLSEHGRRSLVVRIVSVNESKCCTDKQDREKKVVKPAIEYDVGLVHARSEGNSLKWMTIANLITRPEVGVYNADDEVNVRVTETLE